MRKVTVFFTALLLCIAALWVTTRPEFSESVRSLSGYAALSFGLIAVLVFITAFRDENRKLRDEDRNR